MSKYSMFEESWSVVGGLLLCVLCIIVVAACTTKPPGCPLPEYSKGAVVLVDEVFIGKVLIVQVESCGDIKYTLELNVTDDEGTPVVIDGVVEGRLSPYESEPEPNCE